MLKKKHFQLPDLYARQSGQTGAIMTIGLIKNNLKLMLRSRWILLLLCVAPLMVIILLSNAFDDMMNLDYTMEPFKVGYRIDGDHPYKTSLDILSDLCREQNITLVSYPQGDIRTLIDDQTVTVFVTLNDDRMTLYRHEDSDAQAALAEALFGTVLNQASEMSVLAGTGLSAPVPGQESAVPPTHSTEKIVDTPAGISAGKLSVIEIETDPVPSAKDYYGIIEIVYFIWCGCLSLAAVIPSERKNRIGARLRLTSATNLQLYLGKFVPCWLAIMLELSVPLLISVVFLDVRWGNWPVSLLILFLLSLAATAFGMVLFTVFSHIAVSIAAGWLIIYINGYIGGSFMTYMYTILPSDVIRWAPQYYINRTLVEFSTQGHSEYTSICILVLTAVFLVSVAVSLPIHSKKEGTMI